MFMKNRKSCILLHRQSNMFLNHRSQVLICFCLFLQNMLMGIEEKPAVPVAAPVPTEKKSLNVIKKEAEVKKVV